ncbi:MAG TPA: T9SS type A sorting domain-containing protein [Paludibacter sp.]|nr:T9SS type A sorting domain-containing protein [Paludibacter sp.]
MKKKLLLFALLGSGVLLYAQPKITFEDEAVGATTLAEALWGAGTVEVVANPHQTGINTSSKALRVVSNDYVPVLYDLSLPAGDKTAYPYTKVRYKLCYLGPNGGDDFKYPNTDFYSVPNSSVSYEAAETSPAVMKFGGDVGWSGGVSWGDPVVGTWTQCEFSFSNATLAAIAEGKLVIKVAKKQLEYLIDDIELIPVPAAGNLFTVDDFESYASNTVLNMKRYSAEDATATVEADPADVSNKAVHLVTSNWDALLKLNVTLPAGKTLADYDKLSFDIYLVNGYDNNYKQMNIYVDDTKIYVDEGYPSQAPDNTWTNKEYALNNITSGNTLVLDLGISTDNGNYYIDNIVLHLKTSTHVKSTFENALNVRYTNGYFMWNQLAQAVKIVDINGRLVATAANTDRLYVSQLSRGIYIVKTEINGTTHINKVVK